jgi:hypothetical protein
MLTFRSMPDGMLLGLSRLSDLRDFMASASCVILFQ